MPISSYSIILYINYIIGNTNNRDPTRIAVRGFLPSHLNPTVYLRVRITLNTSAATLRRG